MNTAKRLRRSPEGGYARGEETRHRIIEAAVELFGEHGFEGASTRDIAARAGVNAPALQYYFENKEGVYRACVEALADDAWQTFAPAVEHAQQMLRENADTEVLIDAFLGIQDVMADRTFEKANKPGRRMFFAREQAGYEPESATRILACKIREPLNDASAALLSRITGRAADDPTTLIRSFSLHGQLVIFHVAHRSTLAMLGWTSIDAQKAEQLKSTIREQTRTLLEHWSREREEAALVSANAARTTKTTKVVKPNKASTPATPTTPAASKAKSRKPA
ncbi:CerR family C-terminal domain-containing protein [Paraburkholderia bryophila]|uniref:CerR family C-terminal domain-containing protein n=1 Tax=Paraburkholderia bryophila TaxID=420952 RepID=UPI00234BD506|nr:CerR family C-terminal domain-containing protein [Paraburkholderia bryophila]WCM22093.1 CerR family C-terminal domain-containing protein [Paraburkholderia bryophila]